MGWWSPITSCWLTHQLGASCVVVCGTERGPAPTSSLLVRGKGLAARLQENLHQPFYGVIELSTPSVDPKQSFVITDLWNFSFLPAIVLQAGGVGAGRRWLSCALLGPMRPACRAVTGVAMLGQRPLALGWFCRVLCHSLGKKKIILLASWLHSAIAVLCVSMSCWLGCSPGAQTFPAAAAALGGQETLSSSL